MTELTHLLGCELTPVEKSLIGYGESRGMRAEQERIIEIIETCPRTDNNRTIDAPMLIKLIKGEAK